MRLLVTGHGRMVGFVARHFVAVGHHVTALVADPAAAMRLAEGEADTVVVGSGSDPSALEAADARLADAVLALEEHDERNLATCQLCRVLFDVPRTLALVNDPDNETVFRALGIDVAFSLAPLLASLIEQRTKLQDVLSLVPMAEGAVRVTELVLRSGAPAAGLRLAELVLPEGGLVACVVRGGQAIVPRGVTQLAVGDRLVVVAAQDRLGDVVHALVGENGAG